MPYLKNGNFEVLETIDDFYILLEQEMGREIREWLEGMVDDIVYEATRYDSDF